VDVRRDFDLAISPVAKGGFEAAFGEQEEQIEAGVGYGAEGVGLAGAGGAFEKDVYSSEKGRLW
jgi:hypothetical protein